MREHSRIGWLGKMLAISAGMFLADKAQADKPENPDVKIEHKLTAPPRLSRGDMPAIVPSELANLDEAQRKLMAEQVLAALKKILASTDRGRVEALTEAERSQVYKPIFETGRLNANAMRNALLRMAPLLNPEQIKSLELQHGKLAAEPFNTQTPSYAEVEAWIKARSATVAGRNELYTLYRTLESALRQSTPAAGAEEAEPALKTAPEPETAPTPATTEEPTAETPATEPNQIRLNPDGTYNLGQGMKLKLELPRFDISPVVPTAPQVEPPAEAAPEAIKPAKKVKKIEAREARVPNPSEGMFHSAVRKHTADGQPAFYFSFDDGPHPSQTKIILDECLRQGVKATFFLTGESIRTYGRLGLIERMRAEGHAIGLHSDKHADMRVQAKNMTPEQAFAENILKPTAELAKLGIVPDKIFRPPYGEITPEQFAYFTAQGYYVVGWDNDAAEYKFPTTEKIVRVITAGARPGSFTLLHDGGGKHPNTVAAFPQIVRDLQAQGYSFETVPFGLNLANAGGAAAERGEATDTVTAATAVVPEAAESRGRGERAAVARDEIDETPDGGARELPPGAFGLDQWGQPYAWPMMAHKFLEKDTDLEKLDLCEPFEGRDTSGKTIAGLRLTKEARQAMQALEAEFAAEQNPELQAIGGIFATEAGRTIAYHKGKLWKDLVERYGEETARKVTVEPGFSEHHTFNAIDFNQANRLVVYNFFMNPEKALRDKNFVPRIIRLGFIPTARGEPWHWRFVGTEKAKEFYQKYRVEIIKTHTRLLRK
ncbi:MAG: polysaccharide deacetylase family protein [Candidatus Magasanikbacteria bacterium]|nr:polysaccharide deacetylase family protein [Candidatus Magasanikbacteria bacterium]